MKVLVINAGSSSLKYQLIDMETEQCLVKGFWGKMGNVTIRSIAEGMLIGEIIEI